jgi:hypothetical protein
MMRVQWLAGPSLIACCFSLIGRASVNRSSKSLKAGTSYHHPRCVELYLAPIKLLFTEWSSRWPPYRLLMTAVGQDEVRSAGRPGERRRTWPRFFPPAAPFRRSPPRLDPPWESLTLLIGAVKLAKPWQSGQQAGRKARELLQVPFGEAEEEKRPLFPSLLYTSRRADELISISSPLLPDFCPSSFVLRRAMQRAAGTRGADPRASDKNG